MKAFACLLRREFWENRGAFLTLPLGIGGFIVFVTLLIVTGAATTINKIDGEKRAHRPSSLPLIKSRKWSTYSPI